VPAVFPFPSPRQPAPPSLERDRIAEAPCSLPLSIEVSSMSSHLRLTQAAALFATASLLSTWCFANEAQREQKIPSPPPSGVAPVKTAPVLPVKAPVVGPAVADALVSGSQEPKDVDSGDEIVVAPARQLGQTFHYQDENGHLWAMGDEYKSSFSPSGAIFYPRFPDALAHTPVEFSLADVTIGGQPLSFQQGVSAVRTADRIEYLRGSLVEVYEIRPEGMEQMFVFPSLPNAGDVVVRVGLETGMTAGQGADGSIQFTNEHGGFGYSQAVAIDAAGERLSLETQLVDGAIEIRVPAAFAEGATLPLTIDPLVGSVFVVNTPVAGRPNSNADVAHDVDTGNFLIVWESAFNAGDHDIFGQRKTAAGVNVGAAITIDFTIDFWARPRVASTNLGNNYLVVAQEGAVGARVISGCVVSGAGVAGAQFLVSDASVGEKTNPDVGGDPVTVGPTYYFVVWEYAFSAADHDIYGRRMTSAGAPDGGAIFIETSTANESNPSVSKSDGTGTFATQRWTVTFQRTFGPGDEDIYGAQYLWDASLVNSTYLIDFSALNDTAPQASTPLTAAAIASGERDYLVTYTRGVGVAGRRVRVHLLNDVNSLVNTELYSLLPSAPFSTDQWGSSVDSDGVEYALAYTERFSGADIDTHIASFRGTGGTTFGATEDRVIMGFSTTTEELPQVCSDMSGGAASGAVGYMAAWQDSTGVAANAIIEGARYTRPAAATATGYCFGKAANCPCGNAGALGRGCANSIFAAGAVLTAAGVADVSADTLVLTGTDMTGSTALFFQGSSAINDRQGSPFGDGLRCAGGSVFRLGIVAVSGVGVGSYPVGADPAIHISGGIPVGGGTRYYQGWYRNIAAFCTPDGWNLTNGLIVIWRP